MARACATNPVALIVPCHRVIREDGDLAGYRWGVERKQALLEGEKKMKEATKLYEDAAAVEPQDAMERLDVEMAKSELED